MWCYYENSITIENETHAQTYTCVVQVKQYNYPHPVFVIERLFYAKFFHCADLQRKRRKVISFGKDYMWELSLEIDLLKQKLLSIKLMIEYYSCGP